MGRQGQVEAAKPSESSLEEEGLQACGGTRAGQLAAGLAGSLALHEAARKRLDGHQGAQTRSPLRSNPLTVTSPARYSPPLFRFITEHSRHRPPNTKNDGGGKRGFLTSLDFPWGK